MPSEKRIDPEDGAAYTWEELSAYYTGTYKKNVIASYWDTCKPEKKSKGKGKGKGEGRAEKVNYSILRAGDKLQAMADDGKWYSAQVVTVSKSKDKVWAPVKVNYVGYTAASDEWLGADRLRSKALTESAEAAPANLADRHVTIVPYFTVPEGKMDAFKAGFVDFYKGTREGTKSCIYYGFAISGNTVFCREGYKDAAGVLEHLSDVKAPLDKAVEMVGKDGLKLSVMGPKAELEKLKDALTPLGTVFWETDAGSLWLRKKNQENDADTHVTIVPYFTVPEGKMGTFKKGFKDFYKGTRSGTKDCFYYGFAVSGNQVHCREGYANAEACLAHLNDVKAPLDRAVKLVGEGGLKLAVMGPEAELEKLKPAMSPLGAEFFNLDPGSMWFGRRAVDKPDNHVTIVPYFTVPEGKMDDFKAGFKDFYKGTKNGTRSCLYYGFATAGNQVHCREGYRDAAAVLAHLDDVKAPLDKAVEMVGKDGLKLAVMGPKAELEKLKEAMSPLGTVFWEQDEGSLWFGRRGAKDRRDRHVTIVPYFTVPAGKMDAFKAGFKDFYDGTRAGTKSCLYYGFATAGDQVFCREGYKNAEAVLAHLGDVKAPLDKAVEIVGKDGLKLAVMGPQSELDKLKEALDPLGTVYWALDGGALWR
jgi:quinol monooxygenase YgiN